MTLYTDAIAKLSPSNAQDWDNARHRIGSVDATGVAVVNHIETECQLSSHPAPLPDTTLMESALHDIANRSGGWAIASTSVPPAYETCVEPHKLRGNPIRKKPTVAYRYVSATRLFEQIAHALDAMGGGTELRSRINDVRDGNGTWNDVLRYVKRDDVWTKIPREEILLCCARSMFVTFDGENPINRKSTRAIYEALALFELPPHLVEVRYIPDDNDILRFPTFADAGWCENFQGVDVAAPHGWTKPLSNALPQPEAVQAVIKLDRIEPNGLALLHR